MKKSNKWSKTKANNWYDQLPWLVGCNFIPSNAINQLEMWQQDSFDPEIIDKELGFAADLGFNSARVYLHDLLWEENAQKFKKRIDQFLGISAAHNIKPIFVLFDDCWKPNPKLGKQPAPEKGIHNSGWMQSPGRDIVNNPEKWQRLENYVKDIIKSFGDDNRILLWDLYNEPGNEKQEEKSLPLLKKVFEWARDADPGQPLTAGIWDQNKELNDFQLSASDVITFHNYKNAEELSKEIIKLKELGRPVICTEWMARTLDSNVQTHLPIFKNEKVGCYNWGLVSGKTQTIFAWDVKNINEEPELWFHDLLRKDGSPYNDDEISLFKKLTGAEK